MKIALSYLIPRIISVALLLAPAAAQADPWADFKSRFISPDGRVIDYFQDQSSHSEGQSYGMLLAVFHGEPALFEKIWSWTRNNLQVRRTDQLLAWHWGRRPNGQWTVLDYNNASDGDLLAAWALFLAAEKWRRPDYQKAAGEIATSLSKHVLLQKDSRWFLLPGYHSFVQADVMDINPSYLVFPAMGKLADLGGPWPKLLDDSRRLLAESLFSPFKLPADWVRYQAGTLAPHPERGTKFAYEAIRVPLYLAWDGRLADLPAWGRVLDLVEKLGYVPEFFDLLQGSAALNPAGAGFYAVFARTARDLGRDDLSRRLKEEAGRKLETETDNYFSQVLYLLAEAQL